MPEGKYPQGYPYSNKFEKSEEKSFRATQQLEHGKKSLGRREVHRGHLNFVYIPSKYKLSPELGLKRYQMFLPQRSEFRA